MNLASFRRRIRFIRRLLTVVLVFFFAVVASMAFVNIDERYYATGIVRPKNVYSVFATANAFVKEQTVDEGAFVQEGDLLYRLDDWDLRKQKVTLENERRELAAQIQLQEVNIARATDDSLPQWLRTPEIDVTQSQKQVDERQREVERLEKLIGQGAVSELEVDRARLELQASLAEQQRNQKKQELVTEGFAERAVDAANAQADVLRARLQSIEAQEEVLKQDFARREIRAPVASTVTLAMSDLGEPVKEGQEMMRLYSGEEVGIELWGPERNFYRVRPGQKVKFDTNLYSALREGYSYGTVEIVALDSDVSESSSSTAPNTPARPPRYYIWVKIDSTPVSLSLGATARAEISLRRDAVYKILFNLD